MNTFTSHQLRKAGFAHDFQKDFTDDGTRFQIWVKDGVTVSYAKNDGMVFLSIRPDYDGLSYNDYKMFPSYGLADKFNGVDEDKVDMDEFAENFKQVAADIAKFKAGEQVFETDVDKMTRDELKTFLGKKYWTGRNKLNNVFDLAWEYGHSAGHHEVENYFMDLAPLSR